MGERYPWYTLDAKELRDFQTVTVILPTEPAAPLGVYAPLASLNNSRSAVYLARHGLGPAVNQPAQTLSPGSLRAHSLPLPYPKTETPPVFASLAGPGGDRAKTPYGL